MTNDLSIVRDFLGEELSPDSIDSAVKDATSVIPRLVEAWYPNAHRDEFPARRPGSCRILFPAVNGLPRTTVGRFHSPTTAG